MLTITESKQANIKDANSDPVLTQSSGEWNASYVQIGSVLLIGDTLHMWYDGSSNYTPTFLVKTYRLSFKTN
jgi:hypothetical protein